MRCRRINPREGFRIRSRNHFTTSCLQSAYHARVPEIWGKRVGRACKMQRQTLGRLRFAKIALLPEKALSW
jgi:hypothetical protein